MSFKMIKTSIIIEVCQRYKEAFLIKEIYQTFSLPSPNPDDSVSVDLNFFFLFLVLLVLLVGDGRRVAAVLRFVVLFLLFDAGHAVDVLDLLGAVLDLSSDLVVDFQDSLK